MQQLLGTKRKEQLEQGSGLESKAPLVQIQSQL